MVDYTEASAYMQIAALNRVLRQAGLNPSAPHNWPHQNAAKANAWRALRKTGLAGR